MTQSKCTNCTALNSSLQRESFILSFYLVRGIFEIVYPIIHKKALPVEKLDNYCGQHIDLRT